MESTASPSSDPPSDAPNGSGGFGEGDEISCEQGKLFVGGIPWNATEEDLREYFGKYGQVVEIIIMKDRVTGNPRGFGFVSFADPSSADIAIQDSSAKHSILGRPVDVKRAKPKGGQSQIREEHAPENSGSESGHVGTKKIFVGGLSATLTKEEFRSYFEKFGKIVDVVVMNDNVTHRPRGFGFVTFESEESVETAVQQTFQSLGGKTVEVKRAVPKEGGRSPGRNRSNGASGYGGFSLYQNYPAGMYTQGARMMYPGYSPYGYGPSGYGPGYFYGFGGYGAAYPGPRGQWNGPGFVAERRNPAVSHHHHHHPVNDGADLDSQVQYVASQLGGASLEDRRVSEC